MIKHATFKQEFFMDERKAITLILAGISFVADIITLFQFISSGYYLLFWSFRWIIGIIFILGFFWAGVGLLQLAESTTSTIAALILCGIGYLVASLVVYVSFSMKQVSSFGDYMGFTVLLVVPLFFGTLSLRYASSMGSDVDKILRFTSYGYGFASLFLAFSLVRKYVFAGHPFEWGIFIGEIVLLIGGSLLFIAVYELPPKN